MPCAPQDTPRKAFPLNLGGSDTCYFCKKRVYVMERLSAEGHFFHRECFRCSVCATTLRLAAYAFDGDEGNPLPSPRVSTVGSCPSGGSGTPSNTQGAQCHRESCPGSLGVLWTERPPAGGRGSWGRGSAHTWWVLALRAPAECRQLCVRFLIQSHHLAPPKWWSRALSSTPLM